MKYKNIFPSIFHHALSILWVSFIVGIFIFFSFVGYTFYLKSQHHPSIEDITWPSTEWVKSDFNVYYVLGEELHRVQINGEEDRTIFTMPDRIVDYKLSTKGQLIAVYSDKELWVLNSLDHKAFKIMDLFEGENNEKIKTGFFHVTLSPDNRFVVFETHQSSLVSSQTRLFLYNLQTKVMKEVSLKLKRFHQYVWSQDSKILYGFYQKALDTQYSASLYQYQVYAIDPENPVPQAIYEGRTRANHIPLDSLAIRGILLHYEDDDKFKRPVYLNEQWNIDSGDRVGIDQWDNVYIRKWIWFKKVVFRIKRQKRDGDLKHMTHDGGDMLIEEIGWLPQERYIFIHHRLLGGLILDSHTSRAGAIVSDHRARLFKWPSSL